MSLLLAFCSMFGAAVERAVVPAINAELVLLGASAALRPRHAIVVIAAATPGRMVKKVGRFNRGRGGRTLRRGRIEALGVMLQVKALVQ